MTTCPMCSRVLTEYEIEENICDGCGYDSQEEDLFDPSDLNEDDQYFENNRELDQLDQDLL